MKQSFFAAIFCTSFCLIFTGCDDQEKSTTQDSPATVSEKIADLDTIVTAEIAAEIAGCPAGEVTKEYKPSDGNRDTDVLTYSWNNGRKKMAGAIEVPTLDKVAFGWLRKSDLAAVRGKSTNPAFKDFMETVDGIGEFALWNSRDQQLNVLKNGREFSIWISISGDEAVNKAKSLELAEKIISGPLK